MRSTTMARAHFVRILLRNRFYYYASINDAFLRSLYRTIAQPDDCSLGTTASSLDSLSFTMRKPGNAN